MTMMLKKRSYEERVKELKDRILELETENAELVARCERYVDDLTEANGRIHRQMHRLNHAAKFCVEERNWYTRDELEALKDKCVMGFARYFKSEYGYARDNPCETCRFGPRPDKNTNPCMVCNELNSYENWEPTEKHLKSLSDYLTIEDVLAVGRRSSDRAFQYAMEEEPHISAIMLRDRIARCESRTILTDEELEALKDPDVFGGMCNKCNHGYYSAGVFMCSINDAADVDHRDHDCTVENHYIEWEPKED